MSPRNEIVLPKPDEVADPVTNRPAPVKKHKCNLCPARFKKQRLLLAHKKAEHKYFGT